MTARTFLSWIESTRISIQTDGENLIVRPLSKLTEEWTASLSRRVPGVSPLEMEKGCIAATP